MREKGRQSARREADEGGGKRRKALRGSTIEEKKKKKEGEKNSEVFEIDQSEVLRASEGRIFGGEAFLSATLMDCSLPTPNSSCRSIFAPPV